MIQAEFQVEGNFETVCRMNGISRVENTLGGDTSMKSGIHSIHQICKKWILWAIIFL